MRTFCELSPVELTGFELYCDDVAEGFMKELYWDSQSAHDGGRMVVRLKVNSSCSWESTWMALAWEKGGDGYTVEYKFICS